MKKLEVLIFCSIFGRRFEVETSKIRVSKLWFVKLGS